MYYGDEPDVGIQRLLTEYGARWRAASRLIRHREQQYLVGVRRIGDPVGFRGIPHARAFHREGEHLRSDR